MDSKKDKSNNKFNDDNNGKNNKGDEDMAKTATLQTPELRKTKTHKAIEEVRMIRSGKLPRQSARDFLRESRNK